MIISRFTEPELEYFRKVCKFSGDEIFVFEYRSQDIPLADIAELLNISLDKIKKISRKVNHKIIKAL